MFHFRAGRLLRVLCMCWQRCGGRVVTTLAGGVALAVLPRGALAAVPALADFPALPLADFPALPLAEGTSGVTGPHGDTLGALLLVMCLALGLILLCRPSGRHAESKLEKLDEE